MTAATDTRPASPSDYAAPSAAAALAIVRRELAPGRRGLYAAMLVAVATLLGLLLSLWLTEPGPLPPRLHAGFGALALLNAGWCVALVRILVRRGAVVDDRILLARTAVLGASLFGIVGTAVALSRESASAATAVVALSLTFVALASGLLARALAVRRDLLGLKAALTRSS